MLQESDERPPLWSASIFLRSVVEGGMKICFIHHYLSKHPSIHHGELRFDSQECAGFIYSIPVYWAYVQIITHPHTIWISILGPPM